MIDDTPISPTVEQPLERFGPPPLRLHHFFVATAVIALLLSVNTWLRDNDTRSFSGFMMSGQGVVYTIVTGLALTLVLYGAAWRREGRAFFDLPGHWLLVQQALAALVFIAFAVGNVLSGFTADRPMMWVMPFYFLFMNVFMICVCLYAAKKIADTLAWRLLFVADALRIVAALVIPIMIQFTSMRQFTFVLGAMELVTFAILIIAAVGDRRAGRQRDWPHWVGVWLRLAREAFFLVFSFFASFLFVS
jgi:hypothetical protein